MSDIKEIGCEAALRHLCEYLDRELDVLSLRCGERHVRPLARREDESKPLEIAGIGRHQLGRHHRLPRGCERPRAQRRVEHPHALDARRRRHLRPRDARIEPRVCPGWV